MSFIAKTGANGFPSAGATISVRLTGTETLASNLKDLSGSSLANPFTIAAGDFWGFLPEDRQQLDVYWVEGAKNLVERGIFRDAFNTDPTGFINPAGITSSYDSTTRKITLTGDLRYYFQGELKELTSPWTSDAHTDSADSYFLSTINGTTFDWSTTSWEFSHLQVAAVRYQTGYKFGINEHHGLLPWEAHRITHYGIGTLKTAGGTFADYTLGSTTAGDRRLSIAQTSLLDEDLPTTNAAVTGGTGVYTHCYLSGTDTINLDVEQDDIIPLSTNNPYYNELSGGTWQQTLLTNQKYTCVWLLAMPATSDTASQKYRYLCIQGQSTGTLAEMEALTTQNLELGSLKTLLPETNFIGKVILRYIGGNWSLTSVETLTGTRAQQVGSPSGTYLSVITSDTTLTGDGTTATPLGIDLTNPNSWTGLQTFKETKQTEYNLTGTVIDPANGRIQYKTLSGNTTFTESLENGQAVILMIDDGTAYTITWPTITWLSPLTSPVAPTLNTTGYTCIIIFKMNSTLYGKY